MTPRAADASGSRQELAPSPDLSAHPQRSPPALTPSAHPQRRCALVVGSASSHQRHAQGGMWAQPILREHVPIQQRIPGRRRLGERMGLAREPPRRSRQTPVRRSTCPRAGGVTAVPKVARVSTRRRRPWPSRCVIGWVRLIPSGKRNRGRPRRPVRTGWREARCNCSGEGRQPSLHHASG